MARIIEVYQVIPTSELPYIFEVDDTFGDVVGVEHAGVNGALTGLGQVKIYIHERTRRPTDSSFSRYLLTFANREFNDELLYHCAGGFSTPHGMMFLYEYIL